MTDTAKPESAPVVHRMPGWLPTDALRDAAITFLIALALFGSLVGLRADTVNNALEITTHFGKALLLSGIVAGLRLAVDLLVWRRVADGETIASLIPALIPVGRALAGFGLVLGFVLYVFPTLRSDLIAWASGSFWWLGSIADLVAFACIAGFVVAAAMVLSRVARIAFTRRTPVSGIAARLTTDFGREFPVALLVIAIALPLLITGASQRYTFDTATQILIYIMLGWGLNVVVGLAGLLNLGYVAFYAVGAYTYALISTELGWSFWVCLPLAGMLAVLSGIALTFPVLRLRGDYLAIVTLAFGEIIRIVILNWQSLTGGANGVNRIPKPTFFGLSFDKTAHPSFHSFFGLEYNPVYRIIFLYYVILVLALITNFVTLRLRRLPIGRAWEALREDEIACRSVGINTVITKLTAFAIGSMFGGFAGAFFSARQGFISPESFTFMESAMVLAIVVLGGLGSQLGVVIAAVVLVGGLERFRELQDYRMLIFGLSMVLVMIWRRHGLMAGRTPSALLHEARSISANLVKERRG
ncbi:MAG TPA: high-affinity branched-chain amino acid ABC transporter permease LivM [Geobacterales bacterium]|nr:high-affinity branched-chain amino acid ABC transporter permease LivM [Geobacterales bacterium]